METKGCKCKEKVSSSLFYPYKNSTNEQPLFAGLFEVSKIVASAGGEKEGKNCTEYRNIVASTFFLSFCWLNETQLGDPRHKK